MFLVTLCTHLDGATRSILVKGAFCNSGENSGHRVSPILWLLLKKTCCTYSILAELIAKEAVCEEDLANYIYKVH